MAEKNWDEVIQAIRAGDRERFREIVLHFQDELRFTVAYHLRGGAERIDEVVHCALVGAFRDLPRFELGRPLGPWLRSIARHEALKEVRRLRTAARRSRELLEAEVMQARAERESSPEMVAKLRRCLDKLKEGAREMVTLRYVEGKGCDLIAKALGRTAGAVRVAMLQIRRSLKLCMEKLDS